ncbi:MAG: PH domain-containing protein [Planctomycetota bacterium]
MPNESLPPLLYRCPICTKEVAVPLRMIGDTVRCPEAGCEQPIFVEAPRAEFLGPAPTDGELPAVATRAPADQERQLLTLRPSMWRNSPVKFGGGWLGVAASAGFMVWALFTGNGAVGWLSAALFVLLLLSLAVWWLNVFATALIVTTRRTTLRKGIFEKNTNEVQHDDVRNIQVEQNVMDRMLGVGTLKVSSAGQDGLEIIVEGILHPGDVAQTIRANQ